MCHTITHRHSCGHSADITLSSCRGTITKLVHPKAPPLYNSFNPPILPVPDLDPGETSWIGTPDYIEPPVIRSHLAPACTRISTVTLRHSWKCGPCLYLAFSLSWSQRIEIASTKLYDYQAGLHDPDDPWASPLMSAEQQERLVELDAEMKDLEEQRDLEAWKVRRRYPPGGKMAVERKNRKVGSRVFGASPLAQEVRIEAL